MNRLQEMPGAVRSLLAAGLVAILATIALTLNEMRIGRDHYVHDAQDGLTTVSLALSAQIERDVQSIRLVMADARKLATSLELARPGVAANAHPTLRNLALGLPVVDNILLINRDGVVVAGNLSPEQPPVEASDRAYFRFHRANAYGEPYIGESNISRTTGHRVLQITQRINDSQGRFAGVVLVAVRHDYLAGLFRTYIIAAGGTATLFRTDGRLLARYPVPDAGAFQIDASGMALFTEHLPRSPEGSYFNPSALVDGVPRYFSYRKVGDLPLVVAVSRHQDEVLAPWRAMATRQAIIAGLVICSLSGLIAYLIRAIYRQEHQGRALAASEGRFRTLFDNAADAIILVRRGGRIVAVNGEAAAVLGQTAEALVDRSLVDFIAEPAAAEVLLCLDSVRAARPLNLEAAFRTRDGTALPVEFRFTEVDWGGATLLLGVARDIRERKAYQAELQRQAAFDELTQVPKRALFMDRLDQAMAMARRRDWLVGVLFVDLDHFKDINDTYGHGAGDGLLRSAARRMQEVLRQVDTVGRFGGDEFTVLLPEILRAEDIDTVAGKLCEVFRQPFLVDGRPVRLSASIGVAIFPRDGEDGESLVRHADEAMYGAKTAGRDQVRRYGTA